MNWAALSNQWCRHYVPIVFFRGVGIGICRRLEPHGSSMLSAHWVHFHTRDSNSCALTKWLASWMLVWVSADITTQLPPVPCWYSTWAQRSIVCHGLGKWVCQAIESASDVPSCMQTNKQCTTCQAWRDNVRVTNMEDRSSLLWECQNPTDSLRDVSTKVYGGTVSGV